MKKIVIAVLALGLAACGKPADQAAGEKKTGAAAASGPVKDSPAPAMALEKIVLGDLKPVKGWEDLKGKAVVLEFWGTWCDPCVNNIPHMNELAEKFKDRPVVFISVTRDQQDVVEKFLKTHEMKGNVAVEAAAAFKAFQVRGIPHTVLVDKDGVIRAFSYPSMVTPDSIEALLAGNPVPGAIVKTAKAEAGTPAAAGPAPDGKSLAFFSVSPSDSTGRTKLSRSEVEFTYEGAKLEEALAKIMESAQVVEYKGVGKELLAGRYNITCKITMVSGADNTGRLRDTAAAGLAAAFPFTIKTSRGNRAVMLLKKAAGSAGPAAAATTEGYSESAGGKTAEFSTKGYPLSGLRDVLQDWLKTPVLDETGLKGAFAYDFKADSRDVKAVNVELKKMGLALVQASRDIEIAMVTGTGKK